MDNSLYLSGDFSGIQNYVLAIKSSGKAQAKRLRARSARVELFERAALWNVKDRLGISGRDFVNFADCPQVDDIPDPNGFISLSTFQPAENDPKDGFWKSFIKYGKIAPDFHHIAIFKRPQVMFEAGACFRTSGVPKPFYGTPIGPDRLLAKQTAQALAKEGVRPVQAAFALAVPFNWREEIEQ